MSFAFATFAEGSWKDLGPIEFLMLFKIVSTNPDGHFVAPGQCETVLSVTTCHHKIDDVNSAEGSRKLRGRILGKEQAHSHLDIRLGRSRAGILKKIDEQIPKNF